MVAVPYSSHVGAASDAIATGFSHARKREAGFIPRPRNAFIIYWSTISTTDVIPMTVERDFRHRASIVGQLWRNMNEEAREPFQEMARVERETHKLKYPHYQYKSPRRVVLRRRRKVDATATSRKAAIVSLVGQGVGGVALETMIAADIRQPPPLSKKRDGVRVPVGSTGSSDDYATGDDPDMSAQWTAASPVVVASTGTIDDYAMGDDPDTSARWTAAPHVVVASTGTIDDYAMGDDTGTSAQWTAAPPVVVASTGTIDDYAMGDDPDTSAQWTAAPPVVVASTGTIDDYAMGDDPDTSAQWTATPPIVVASGQYASSPAYHQGPYFMGSTGTYVANPTVSATEHVSTADGDVASVVGRHIAILEGLVDLDVSDDQAAFVLRDEEDAFARRGYSEQDVHAGTNAHAGPSSLSDMPFTRTVRYADEEDDKSYWHPSTGEGTYTEDGSVLYDAMGWHYVAHYPQSL